VTLFVPAASCENSEMKAFLVPVALASVLALSACGGDEPTDSSVERGAASSNEKYTLCVKNDSSRSISSTGDGSPSQPDGFLVRPGESACASTAAGAKEIVQSMMSDIGPSWTTRYAIDEDDNSPVSYLSADLTTCGRTWSNERTISASVSCSGNPFRISVNFNSNGTGPTANVTFADQ
jgi:hypothetical protein